jgi:integrase
LNQEAPAVANIQERCTSKGEKRYKVTIRLKGHPTETATFHRKTDAKRWVQHTEAAIREGRYFKTAAAKRRTLAELIDRYIEEVLPTKPKEVGHQHTQLTRWKKELGDYLLADVTPDRLAEVRQRLLSEKVRGGKSRSPSTVVRYMAALSHVFTVGVKEYGWMDSNPMMRVTKPKEPKGRIRFLDDDERERLLEACENEKEPFLYPIVIVAISTGMRLGEITGLTWDDVDLNDGRITLHETKNGERRVVPLTRLALEVMKKHAKVRSLETKLVFPVRRRDGWKSWDIRTAWNRTVKAAELEDFRFHDLRHTSASYLAMNGATPPEIAAVLGHRTLQMVQRYSHLSEPHTRDVVASMNEKIFG